jgi:maltose alpha-D-glucosyltransferase/alpha-amylase
MTVGILQAFVPNQGDAWEYALDELGRYYEQALALPPEERVVTPPAGATLLELAGAQPPPEAAERIGTSLESAGLLGRRTAELHIALASAVEGPMAPEPFSSHYQRSLYQSMRALTRQVFQLLGSRRRDLPEAMQILDLEDEILDRFRTLLEQKITASRIRCHGDYHLGQVLSTGRDFVIIDFEGEPARPLSERRIKRSPLRDVAGMLRSFHYAAYTPLLSDVGDPVRPEDAPLLTEWGRLWYMWVSASFLGSYLSTARDASFLPRTDREVEVLLDAFLLEKAIYEIAYEANNRPSWLKIPIQGVVQMVEGGG